MSELLTKSEAAKRARITERTLDRHIAAGSGPILVRIGRRVLVRADDMRAWIDQHAVIPPPAAVNTHQPEAVAA